MTRPALFSRRLALHAGLATGLHAGLATGLWACALAASHAAPPADPPLPAKGAAFDLQGQTLDGKPFSTAALRGKAVLVFFWNTDCAVCRSKMPELRSNVLGWQGKPFQLVTVSLDRSRAEAADYDKAVATTVPAQAQLPVLWAGEAGYRDSLGFRPRRLPLSVLVDAQGRVAATYEGRIPPEAWDVIADLIPHDSAPGLKAGSTAPGS
jgi:thiol-disulfide isomerase/thioredoxin